MAHGRESTTQVLLFTGDLHSEIPPGTTIKKSFDIPASIQDSSKENKFSRQIGTSRIFSVVALSSLLFYLRGQEAVIKRSRYYACHSERSEESASGHVRILRCAQ